MTARRKSRSLVVAGLVALVVGAGLAGVATMLNHHPETLADRFSADLPSPVSATPSVSATTLSAGTTTASTTTTSATPTTTATTSAPTTTTKASPPPTTSRVPTTTQALPQQPVEQVVALVNQNRSQAGCAPLRVDSRLTNAAADHSSDMARRGYFSHTTPEGVTFDKRITAAGYPQPGAENIAQGQRSAQQVMNAWMNSAGHRANILNCRLSAIGVGLDTNGWYWTQDFGY